MGTHLRRPLLVIRRLVDDARMAQEDEEDEEGLEVSEAGARVAFEQLLELIVLPVLQESSTLSAAVSQFVDMDSEVASRVMSLVTAVLRHISTGEQMLTSGSGDAALGVFVEQADELIGTHHTQASVVQFFNKVRHCSNVQIFPVWCAHDSCECARVPQVRLEEEKLDAPEPRKDISPTDILAQSMEEEEVEGLMMGLSAIGSRIRACGGAHTHTDASAQRVQAEAFWEKMQSSGSLDAEDIQEVQALAETIGHGPLERVRGVALGQ
jgi:hypothetical protein